MRGSFLKVMLVAALFRTNAAAAEDVRPLMSEEAEIGKPAPIYAEPVGDQPTVVSATQPAGPLGFLQGERLTGDWGGFRSALEAKGITPGLSLTSIYQHNAHGGVRTHHGHEITGSYDASLTLDTTAMGLWKGGTLYVLGEGGWGDGIGDRVGDMFGLNGDATGDDAVHVRELWYEQRFFDDRLRFKLGKLDLAVDIDTNAYANYEATQFINSALINTGNLPLPEFGLGAVLAVKPTDWAYATLAVADAQAVGTESGFETTFHDEDYFFSALELGLTPSWETQRGKLPGNYRFILWYDPQPKERFIEERARRYTTWLFKRDDIGFAFNMDQLVWKENAGDEDQQGLGVFFRYGYAHGDVNAVEHFWSIGTQYQGLLPGRDDDVLGFGFAQGVMSDPLRRLSPTATRESVYELYYSCQVLPWLHVGPDVQYISDPGGDRSGRDAFVGGLRIVMSF